MLGLPWLTFGSQKNILSGFQKPICWVETIAKITISFHSLPINSNSNANKTLYHTPNCKKSNNETDISYMVYCYRDY